MSELLTISDLCRLTGVPLHVLGYALRRHGPPPAARIGIARVWGRDQLELVLASLRLTGAIEASGADGSDDLAVGDRGASPEVML